VVRIRGYVYKSNIYVYDGYFLPDIGATWVHGIQASFGADEIGREIKRVAEIGRKIKIALAPNFYFYQIF
jgi:hypothetical protein